jgi:predicted NUDIX family phosphoesterase
MPSDERVLVIPTDHFRATGYFQGFRPLDEAYRARLLAPEQFSFRPRLQVETDPGFKQLIPYVVLRCGDLLFQYRRGASGTESRLRAQRSVGIGGHISEADAAGGSDPYDTGMRRELAEEIELRTEYTERMLGFINDDQLFVGTVHLGVVHLLDLAEPAAVSREDALVEAGFQPIAELVKKLDEFETWSQFVFEALAL